MKMTFAIVVLLAFRDNLNEVKISFQLVDNDLESKIINTI
jgi:hypothetical protein